jgi:glucose-6-phosphate 1-epimerase
VRSRLEFGHPSPQFISTPSKAETSAFTMIAQLNATHALADRLFFVSGPNEMPVVRIRNSHASAEIHLHGAHLTDYQRQGEKPVLWMSREAYFEASKPIRGGVPICWPWFGMPKESGERPQHGFVRNRQWSVERTRDTEEGTEITFSIGSTPDSIALWPHRFKLTYQLTIGRSLKMELSFQNTGDKPAEVGAALHTYFAVSDAAEIRVTGLDHRQYLDQLDGLSTKVQVGDVTIAEEVDRIYIDTEDECVIHDPAWNRRLRVAKEGSRSTVVWNPWIEKSKRMPDFPDDGYHGMVCIETTNAAGDTRSIQPGDTHRLMQSVTPEPA